jgi:hypothetical protein
MGLSRRLPFGMIQGLRFSTVIGSGCVHYWHIPWTIFASNKQQEAASSSKQQQALVKQPSSSQAAKHGQALNP